MDVVLAHCFHLLALHLKMPQDANTYMYQAGVDQPLRTAGKLATAAAEVIQVINVEDSRHLGDTALAFDFLGLLALVSPGLLLGLLALPVLPGLLDLLLA